MAEVEPIPRQEFEVKFDTEERGKLTLKMLDRINVDDVYLHLVRREVFRVINGSDQGVDVDRLFKDFLIKERFTAGQI